MGKNLPISTLRINSKPIISNMPKAMGETIPITLVRETSKMVVNINPSNSINRITPENMVRPKRKMVYLPTFFPESWLERYTRKPG